MEYLFELGHQPHISASEIATVLQTKNIAFTKKMQDSQWLTIRTQGTLDIQQLQNQLGGTVSIRENLSISPSVDNISEYLAKTTNPGSKIQFSLSGPNNKKIALTIKKNLKSQGHSVRYIEPKNSATILYNGLVAKKSDLLIHQNELWVTRGIQVFNQFKSRDYDRPASDDKSGMLPPKLARIMINLTGVDLKNSLYDPFCGSGTLLLEAISLGFTTIIGSDISDKAVRDSKENITWLSQKTEKNIKSLVQQHDITKKLAFLTKESIDAVASEPFMGNPLHGNESRSTLQHRASDLKKLYVQAFTSLHPVLSKDAPVIFVIPSFKFKQEWIQIDCIHDITNIGYQLEPFGETPYLRYHRPKQHLARDIWKFKKTS